MKEGEEKNIDRKFREGLTNPEDHIVYNDADWDAMEALLDEQKKRRGLILRLPLMLGAAAAILLLALALFFFWPDDNKSVNLTRVKGGAENDSVTSVKTIDGLKQHEEIAKKRQPSNSLKRNDQPTQNRTKQVENNTLSRANSENTIAASGIRTNVNGTVTKSTLQNSKIRKNTVLTNTVKDAAKQELLTLIKIDSAKYKDLVQMQYTLGNFTTTYINDGLAEFIVSVPEKNYDVGIKDSVGAVTISKVIEPTKHPIVLSIIGAPDFNGVGSAFNRTQVGTNVGLLLSVGITRKLTITTGALYSKKPYLVGMDQYHTSYKFSTQPNDVSADCRVLDIPLNINYEVYNKGRNLLSIGTGLSSYFMLRENYHFNYNQYYVGPSDYKISNQNKHILGVVNLNATYQRRINSKFGLNVQPYMKLPITNIGYGQVNLRSTGVAIGASWYLNTSASKK